MSDKTKKRSQNKEETDEQKIENILLHLKKLEKSYDFVKIEEQANKSFIVRFSKRTIMFILSISMNNKKSVRPILKVISMKNHIIYKEKYAVLEEQLKQYAKGIFQIFELLDMLSKEFSKFGSEKITNFQRNNRKVNESNVFPYFASSKSKLFGNKIYIFSNDIEKNFLKEIIKTHQNLRSKEDYKTLINWYMHKDQRNSKEENTILKDPSRVLVTEKLKDLYEWEQIFSIEDTEITHALNKKESLPCLFREMSLTFNLPNYKSPDQRTFGKVVDSFYRARFFCVPIKAKKNRLDMIKFNVLQTDVFLLNVMENIRNVSETNTNELNDVFNLVNFNLNSLIYSSSGNSAVLCLMSTLRTLNALYCKKTG